MAEKVTPPSMVESGSVPNLTDTSLTPPRFIGPFFVKRRGTQDTIFNFLNHVVEDRLREKARAEVSGDVASLPASSEKVTYRYPLRSYQNDLIQWIIDTVPKAAQWSPRRFTYEIIAVWLGSDHVLAAVCVSLFLFCSPVCPHLLRDID